MAKVVMTEREQQLELEAAYWKQEAYILNEALQYHLRKRFGVQKGTLPGGKQTSLFKAAVPASTTPEPEDQETIVAAHRARSPKANLPMS